MSQIFLAFILTLSGFFFLPMSLILFITCCGRMESKAPAAIASGTMDCFLGFWMLILAIVPVMFVAVIFGPIYALIPAIVVLSGPFILWHWFRRV